MNEAREILLLQETRRILLLLDDTSELLTIAVARSQGVLRTKTNAHGIRKLFGWGACSSIIDYKKALLRLSSVGIIINEISASCVEEAGCATRGTIWLGCYSKTLAISTEGICYYLAIIDRGYQAA